MPDISDNANWFELDGGNIQGPPNGWPEGQMPSTVNDCARANMGALKRFWDRINPVSTVTPASGAYTLATSNTTYPTAYVEGERYSFKAAGASVGSDTFQVNTLGAKGIYKAASGGTFAAVAAGDIPANTHPQLVYVQSLNGGAGGFLLQNPFLPITQNGSGGISVPGNVSIGGSLTVSGSSTIPGYLPTSGGAVTGGLTVGAGLGVTGDVSATGKIIASEGGPNGHGYSFIGDGSYDTGMFSPSDGVLNFYTNNTLALSATGGTVTAPQAMLVGGTGIQYNGVGGSNHVGFTWNGSHILGFVDGTGVGAIATGSDLGNYVPVSGGSIAYLTVTSGNLTVQGHAVVISNNQYYYGQDTGGTGIGLIGMGNDNQIWIGPNGNHSISLNGVVYNQNDVHCGGWYYGGSGGPPILATGSGSGLYFTSDSNGIHMNIPNAYACTTTNCKNLAYASSGAGPTGDVLNGNDFANNLFAIWVDQISDARVKRGIADSDIDALDLLRRVPVRAFEYTDETRWPGWRVPIGLVAQELEDLVPEAVGQFNDLRAINLKALVPYLLRAVQQLADKLENK